MVDARMTFVRKTIALFAPICAYLAASQLGNDNLSNLLSMLSAYAAAGILLFVYFRSDHQIKISITFLLYALGCMAWGIADTVWAFIGLTGGNPDDSEALLVIYVLPNCLFVVSLAIYALNQFRKWDLIQIAIDVIINTILSVGLFMMLFFNKDIATLNRFFQADFTGVLSILTDIVIDIGIYAGLLSVRSGKMPVFMRIMAGGLLLFTYVDILYYYLDFHGLYAPNNLIDFAYVLSLAIIAFGALWKTFRDQKTFQFGVMENTGSRRRWIFLLLYPALTIFVSLFDAVQLKLTFTDFLIWFILIFFYWASCKYIQMSIERENILRKNNEWLERRVADQVSELAFLANQDTLTALFNRRYFTSCLDERIKNQPDEEKVALLLIDMDRFKIINDTFGHDMGDRVLIDFSGRLIEWNRYGATIARLGGDEFAVMFAGRYDRPDIESLCKDMIRVCSKPIRIGEHELSLTMSVGIALSVPGIQDGKKLMQYADIAMYRAKSRGYNRFEVFDAFVDDDFRKTSEIEVLLRQANVEKDFELYYQPQYALPDKILIGAEALLRWKNAEHGYIPPAVFIPIAEHIDHIFRIGKWVMQETIRQSMLWNNLYELPLKIGFNISPKQFKDEAFLDLLRSLVKESRVNTTWIDAEITESVMINDGKYVQDVFEAFQELGITVSIDDFGSGYATLGYLNKYPFDRIKIDKSLIDQIDMRNINGANVVKAAIHMAHASGIRVIAEGVETQEQLDILIRLGCDQVQGYLLGRPVPAAVFEERYIQPGSENVG